jgi:CrcB protein
MKTLPLILAVGGGGAIGALLRLMTWEMTKRIVSPQWVFVSTVIVNLTGCLAIGVLGVCAARNAGWSPLTYRFLITGILGSLTTFSTFAFETIELLNQNRAGAALLHVVTNLVVGLALVWCGMLIANAVLPAEHHSAG